VNLQTWLTILFICISQFLTAQAPALNAKQWVRELSTKDTVAKAITDTLVTRLQHADSTQTFQFLDELEQAGKSKIDDNCNGSTDETCVACQTGTGLATTNITSSSAKLNWNIVVTPNAWQIRYKTTKPGAQWVSVDVAGNVNFINLAGLTSKQAYNWQVRANCGKSWTDFSSVATFTTTGVGTVSTLTLTAGDENFVPEGMQNSGVSESKSFGFQSCC
jgi:hypothetical protein